MRAETIARLKKYFNLKELVCPDVFAKYGDFAWNFFRTDFLECLLAIREDILQVPMTINNWSNGGSFSQRGLRCNTCDLCASKTKGGKLYMSAHCNGAGADFSAKGMDAGHARQIILEHANLLPYPIRMESGVSWVHFDTYNDKEEKVIFFKA